MGVVVRTMLVAAVLVIAGAAAPAPAGATSSKPVVTGVSPGSGATSGGAVVTIKGERFHHVRAVLFGSAAGTSVTVASSTKLTVRAPRHAPGTVDVRVETTAGESSKSAKDQYGYKLIWRGTEAPLPPHSATPNVALNAIACASATSCVAVGSYVDANNHQQGLIERLASRHWEAVKVPLPAKAGSNPAATLSAVACPTSSACEAVGTYLDSGNHDDSMIDTFDGATWTAKRAPLPNGVAAGSTAQLDAVACHSSKSCAAVGIYADSANPSQGFQGLVETFASGKWTAAAGPLPADAVTAQNAQLNAVACPAGGSCTAVGVYDNPNQVGLVETLANGVWHAVRSDLPGDANTGFQNVTLDSVSCRSSSACIAAGQYVDNTTHREGLIERLPVGISSGSRAGVPSDGDPTPDVGLSAVSCVASGCSEVGAYRDKDGAPAGLIEPAGGAPTRAPLSSSGASFVDLQAIACPVGGACTTVGFFVDGHGHFDGLIDVQSGVAWKGKIAPLPANAVASPAYPLLNQVACASAISCTAIGEYQDGHGRVEGLLDAE